MPLRQLYPDPAAADSRVDVSRVDIIAIHGLNPRSRNDADHAWDTWRSPSGDQGRLWLRDDLPSSAPKARIFLYEFNATAVYGKDRGTFIDKANSLLEAIRAKRKGADSRPIIFLGHSMGGLLIKQALVNAHNNRKYTSIKDATSGLVFFATPHHGGDTMLVSLGRVLANIARKSGFQKGDDVLKTLEEGSTFSDIMDEHWRHQLLHYSIISFWGTRDNVVPPKSSRLGLPGDCENVVPLDADHSQVCKFGLSQTDQDNLELVKSNIEDVYEAALKKYGHLRENADPSPLQRMDRELERYYNTRKRLHIERLSGDVLAMDTCYINLAIVEEIKENRLSKKVEGGKTASPFSLTTRLRVETPHQNIQFSLPDIFEKRSGRQVPSRVLIRGRAGIGKTTLCKKIVYDFLQGRLWKDLFDRIFWLPLRKLKANDMFKDIEDLFREEYLSQNPGKKDLANDVWTALQTSQYHRSLFLLDGLDEVSDELNKDHKLLKYLMDLPNIIVTSRPHTSLPTHLDGEFHLELETIGFYPHQVEEYVTRYFPGPQPADHNKCTQILLYLEKHRLIQSLMRIPVQLDALCWSWGDWNYQEAQPQTMTAIYQAIEYRLWKKDIVSLGTKENYQVRRFLPAEVYRTVRPDIEILELLAFVGMYSNVIDFGQEDRDTILKLSGSTSDGFDERLSRLSFLRSSGSSKTNPSEEKRTYHFLHLTFQEYFAARYFVRKWKASKNLECVSLVASKRKLASKGNFISPVEFLRRTKYSSRYDIVWRFVAGLLDLDGEPEETERFFRALDQEPLDLLGIAHQRLVMHCLSEARSESFSLRGKLEDHLSQWLVFQCKSILDIGLNFSQMALTLASEFEFPERSLAGILEEDERVQAVAFNSMKQLRQIPSQIIERVLSLLETAETAQLLHSLFALLARSRDKLPEKALYSIASYLKNQDANLRVSAAHALNSQRLPGNVYCTIATWAGHLDTKLPSKIGLALSGQSMPRETLIETVAMLKSDNRHIREVASEALSRQSDFPTEVISSIAANIENSDRQIQRVSVFALHGQSTLPDNLTRLLATITDKSDMTSLLTIRLFSKLSNRPDHLLGTKIAESINGRQPATIDQVKAWCNKSRLSAEILDTLRVFLGSQEKFQRRAAASLLAGQSNLSVPILSAIVGLLEDNIISVRTEAANALSHQLCLPEGTTLEIVAILKKGKPSRKAALQAFKDQSNSSKRILDEISHHIEDRDPSITTAALNALAGQSYLSDSPHIWDKVIACIKHTDASVVEATLQAVRASHPRILSNDFLSKVVEQINNPNKRVRWATVQLLHELSAWSEDICHDLALQLDDSKSIVPASSNWFIGNLVERKEFHSDFLLRGPWQPLLIPLLVRGFREQLAWYIDSGHSYLETANGHEKLALCNEGNIKYQLRLARQRAGVPSVAASPSSESFFSFGLLISLLNSGWEAAITCLKFVGKLWDICVEYLRTFS
ncbi:uncharacterized protein N7500_003630 [Penicillium coprophilum]|uniref:uncharacterized protein n=1 Tax=Penicillium coprophilum TaxID=36646 RepID=UPI002398FA93|nr:uncharacterized protein N7500_003630 [Penicillium coprophilum]KAJ5170847.1 hypothetical protein N7500_003630 [Penicillium coprophilum]